MRWQPATDQWQPATDQWQPATDQWQPATDQWQPATDQWQPERVLTIVNTRAENRFIPNFVRSIMAMYGDPLTFGYIQAAKPLLPSVRACLNILERRAELRYPEAFPLHSWKIAKESHLNALDMTEAIGFWLEFGLIETVETKAAMLYRLTNKGAHFFHCIPVSPREP